MANRIVSFGFKHGEPTAASEHDKLFDIRQLFRNPWGVKALQSLTGQDLNVQEYIKADLRFAKNYYDLSCAVGATGGTAFIGCRGGKHRSVALAEMIAREFGIPVEHRDMLRK